jgi:hypothetical protein
LSLATAAIEDVRDVAAPSRTTSRMRLLAGFIVAADLLTVLLSVAVAWDLRLVIDVWAVVGAVPDRAYPAAGPWITLGWLAVLGAHGAYTQRIFGTGLAEFRAVGQASMFLAGFVGLFCYIVQVPLSRGFVLMVFLVGTPALMAERYAVRKFLQHQRARGRMVHRVLAVGGPTGISEIVDVLERESHVGYRVVGACLPVGRAGLGAMSVPVLGDTGDVRAVCEEVGADTVLVTRGGYDSAAEMRRIAWALEGSDVELVVVPSLTDIAGPRISMRPVAGLPLLHVEQPQAGEAGGLAKRLFDVLLSAVLLALLSPVMLAVALAVKLHDGGPVLFRQTRVGRTGDEFGMLKFRSMVVDRSGGCDSHTRAPRRPAACRGS